MGGNDELTEDSMDGAPPSVGSDSYPASVTNTPLTSHNTPTTTKKIKIFQKRMVTGYIVYSGEERKNVAARYPDATFGEVSRLVGEQWRNLPSHIKTEYEDRAQRTNEETVAEMARNPGADNTPTVTTVNDGPVNGDVVFDCCWKKCDWQGDEIGELSDHLLQEPNGHVLTTINPNGINFTFYTRREKCCIKHTTFFPRQIPNFNVCGEAAAEFVRVSLLFRRWNVFYVMCGKSTLPRTKDVSFHPPIATSKLKPVVN